MCGRAARSKRRRERQVATKRIKLLKPWTTFAVGAEVEFQTSVADLLIQRGRAVEVKETPATVSRKALKKALRAARANESK